ncbi:MAG: hypothetical protein GW802_20855 [Armatimonadetes bacterium]|nr:hypothetical protein [Armatimonadota bacterium]
MKTCPVDGETLQAVGVGTLAIDVCEVCGGKWFDDKELTLLTKQGVRAMAQLDADYPNTTGSMPPPGGKACPICEKQELFGFSFKHTPGVVLEGCRGCKGLWLDQGKLIQLAVKLGLPPDEIPQPAAATEAPAAPTEVQCPQCKATNKPTDKQCWQCGASLVPEAPSCPRCATPLVDTERDTIALRVCSDCGGVWLDQASVMQMFQHHMNTCGQLDSSSERREEDLQRRTQPAMCPICKINMQEHDFIAQLEAMYNVPTGIHADRCTTCYGMWFDVGELAAVQQAVAEYRASKQEDSGDSGFLFGGSE